MKPIINFDDIHQKVTKILDITDPIFFEGLSKQNVVSSKSNIDIYLDIVSDYDKRLEDILVQELSENFPDFGFITEETTEREKKEWNWIIDPIDGTFNYVHGIQTCGTSLALWQNNTPLYGVLSFPAIDERVHAIRDQGIYLNNQKLASHHTRLTPTTPLPVLSALAQPPHLLKMIETIMRMVSYPKTFGSSVFHIYLTATHKTDLTVIVNNEIWDIATAELFAKEAGLYTEYPWRKPDVNNVRRDYDLAVMIGEEELVKKVSEEFKKLFPDNKDLK